jgi:hypothetical protein
MVLLTVGGVPHRWKGLNRLRGVAETVFVVPGAAQRLARDSNIITMPQRSGFYHPDLVAAADAVVGKLGYSTLAEVWHTGAPFAFISRKGFRESPVLGDFAEKKMGAIQLAEDALETGDWLDALPILMDRPPSERTIRENGDDAVAGLLTGISSPPRR